MRLRSKCKRCCPQELFNPVLARLPLRLCCSGGKLTIMCRLSRTKLQQCERQIPYIINQWSPWCTARRQNFLKVGSPLRISLNLDSTRRRAQHYFQKLKKATLRVFSGCPLGSQMLPQLMNHLFRAHLRRHVLIFFDDILIYSYTLDDHKEHLRRVHRVLKENSYKISNQNANLGAGK